MEGCTYDVKVRMDVALAQNVLMTSSGSEHDRASGSSDEDSGTLKNALLDHTLHKVGSLADKTPLFDYVSLQNYCWITV